MVPSGRKVSHVASPRSDFRGAEQLELSLSEAERHDWTIAFIFDATEELKDLNIRIRFNFSCGIPYCIYVFTPNLMPEL